MERPPRTSGSSKLFQITYNYLTNVKGLDNLVWVWSVADISGGAGTLGNYWPGNQYVDVAGLDVWTNHQPTLTYYNAMLNLAGTKPIAMSETGTTPTPQTMQAQPRWAWFLAWAAYLVDPAWNTTAGVQATFSDPRVYNQGEIVL